jgi:hypothetical protein
MNKTEKYNIVDSCPHKYMKSFGFNNESTLACALQGGKRCDNLHRQGLCELRLPRGMFKKQNQRT